METISTLIRIKHLTHAIALAWIVRVGSVQVPTSAYPQINRKWVLLGTFHKASCKFIANDSSKTEECLPFMKCSWYPHRLFSRSTTLHNHCIYSAGYVHTQQSHWKWLYLKLEKIRLINLAYWIYTACWTQVVARSLHSFDHLITNGPLKYDRHVQPNLLLLETRQRQMACK